jgi:hypothetical protein
MSPEELYQQELKEAMPVKTVHDFPDLVANPDQI